MSGNERMAVNAAIEKLISGSDPEWENQAQRIIDFAVSIPPAGRVVKRTTIHDSEGSAERISDYVAGQGDVDVHEDGKATVKESFSAPFERVGYYRLIHLEHVRSIKFVHYRVSGVFRKESEGLEEDGFLLSYSKDKYPLALYEVFEFPVKPPLFVRMHMFAVMIKIFFMRVLPHILRRILFLGAGERVHFFYSATVTVPLLRVIYSTKGQEKGQEYVGGVPYLE